MNLFATTKSVWLIALSIFALTGAGWTWMEHTGTVKVPESNARLKRYEPVIETPTPTQSTQPDKPVPIREPETKVEAGTVIPRTEAVPTVKKPSIESIDALRKEMQQYLDEPKGGDTNPQ